MVYQTEIAIAQICEYIQRVCQCQDMQLQEAKERLTKKLAMYSADGCDAETLNSTFDSALKSHTREVFFARIKQSAVGQFNCPRCGEATTHPEGWHFCHTGVEVDRG